MQEHLSDLAGLEWARFQETRLAAEGKEEVAAHLLVCAACREKVAAFEKLERMVHPYGTPPPEDRRPVVVRRILLALLVIAALALLWWMMPG